MTKPEDKLEPECRLCADVGFTSKVYAQELCRWCWEKTRDITEHPHRDLVRMHCQGVGRITATVIRRFHPHYRDVTGLRTLQREAADALRGKAS